MFDKKYKNTLAQYLNIDDISALEPIVGEEEFKYYISRLSEKDFCSKEKSLFCANLHVHTNYSDGQASVSEILECALELTENNLKKDLPFILSITDHDTIEGVKEAVRIISENPEKYRRLKFVPGVEISAVETDMPELCGTLDVHSLVYSINPFDEKLNKFLDDKRAKKFRLAEITLNSLNRELFSVLDMLNISLTLEEAAKIHPMILKGEDEISHPLKKYIFGKLLFAYYVENNETVLNILKKYNVDTLNLSYEKVVHKFKSMFNNERYYYIYKDALEKYLSFLTDGKEIFVLDPIPDFMESALLHGKAVCEAAHPSRGVIQEAFTSFRDCAVLALNLEYGLMSIAHPARLNLKYVQGDIFSFYKNFFALFKRYGSESAFGYEKFYQSYSGKKTTAILPDIDRAADLYDLQHTGGIDSHGKSVCTRFSYY